MALCSARTPPAISAAVSPRVRSATSNAAASAGVAFPRMTSVNAASASSALSGPAISRPTISCNNADNLWTTLRSIGFTPLCYHNGGLPPVFCGDRMKRILVTGAGGQVGTELVPALRSIYGEDAVMATDIKPLPESFGMSETLDCTNADAIADAVRRHRADSIYHLAALLSATAEKNPKFGYDLNTGTLMNVLEVAREANCAMFTPSSIGAFGPTTPRNPTPQDTIQRP